MSAALLNFLPGQMSFEEYFQVSGQPELEKAVRFLVGLAPALLHRHYLADPARVNLQARKGPSTPMACLRESERLGLPIGHRPADPYQLDEVVPRGITRRKVRRNHEIQHGNRRFLIQGSLPGEWVEVERRLLEHHAKLGHGRPWRTGQIVTGNRNAAFGGDKQPGH